MSPHTPPQPSIVTGCVVQARSILFDTDETLVKFGDLMSDAGNRGADLAVFPEAFIGGYPKGIDFGVRVGSRSSAGREMFRAYFDSAVALDDERFARMAKHVASAGVCAVVGFIERKGATLYCSAAIFEKDGTLAGVHRKLMPTAMERIIWGNGDGDDLPVPTLSIGTVCSAICWENYMPLLRAHYYAHQPAFYCVPTVDDRDVWPASMQMIALEGRCFVLSACQYMQRGDVAMSDDYGGADAYDAVQGNDPDTTLIRGGSCIVSPSGSLLAGPVHDQETMLVADLDMAEITRGKFDLDVAGHYARPDIFDLVLRQKQT